MTKLIHPECVVVIDEFSIWDVALSKEVKLLGYDAESFNSVDAFLYALKKERRIAPTVGAIVLALYGRGAAAIWYELAVDRIVRALHELNLAIPAFVFAPNGKPDSDLVKFTVECQAALIRRMDIEGITPILQDFAGSAHEPALPAYYGVHTCKAHPYWPETMLWRLMMGISRYL